MDVFVGIGVSVGTGGVSVTDNVRKTSSVGVGIFGFCLEEQAERKSRVTKRMRDLSLSIRMGAILPLVL
jgi:hypothetical protein